MTRQALLQTACFLGLAACVNAQTDFSFDNEDNNNDWEIPLNWDPNTLPGQDSRIFIEQAGEYAEVGTETPGVEYDLSNVGGNRADQTGLWVGSDATGPDTYLELRNLDTKLIVNDAWTRLGQGPGKYGFMNVFNGATFESNHDIRVGENSGEGRLVVANATVDVGRIVHFNGSYVFQGAADVTTGSNSDGNSGTNLKNIQLLGFNGDVFLRASSNDTDGFQSLRQTGSSMNGGTFTTNRELRIGWEFDSVLDMSGGIIDVGTYLPVGRNDNGDGTINLSGGTINANTSGSDTYLTAFGTIGDAVGVMNQTGGEFRQNGIRGIALGELDNGTGTYNLDGGDLFTPRIFSLNGNGSLNFDGGTLHATQDRADFIDNLTVDVAGGGAFVNTKGFDVTSLSAFTGSGTLAKQGAGTLRLAAQGNDVGSTVVSAGTLYISGQLNSRGPLGDGIIVADGAIIGGTFAGELSSTLVARKIGLNVESGGKIDITDGVLSVTNTNFLVQFGNFSFEDIIGFDTRYGFSLNNTPGSSPDAIVGTYPILNGDFDLDQGGLNPNQIKSNPQFLGQSAGGYDLHAYFDEGSLNVVVIPEPATALLSGLGLLTLAGRRRRD